MNDFSLEMYYLENFCRLTLKHWVLGQAIFTVYDTFFDK